MSFPNLVQEMVNWYKWRYQMRGLNDDFGKAVNILLMSCFTSNNNKGSRLTILYWSENGNRICYLNEDVYDIWRTFTQRRQSFVSNKNGNFKAPMRYHYTSGMLHPTGYNNLGWLI